MSVESRSSYDWAPSFPTSSVRKINYFDLWRKKKAVKEATKRYGVFKFNNGRVFRMGHDAVVKFGGPLTVRPTEAATMEYIAKYTTIPVPRVRDVFKEGKNAWIVMDYIDGQPLDQVWPTLTPDERIKCMQQLKGYIDQLRALHPPHPQRVQAVDGGSSIDTRLHHTTWGPFETIDDFNRFFGHEDTPKLYPSFQSRFDKVAGKKWRIVFAHGDLAPHNILWRDGRIVAIIDWSYSGWFPEYWEYTRTRYSTAGPVGEGFWQLFQDVVDVYPDELEVEECLNDVYTRV